MKRCAEFAGKTFSSRTGAVVLQRIAILLVVAVSSLAQDVPSAQTFSISGVVKSGNSLIPGATVTASNSATGEKTATSTDINGAYTLPVGAPGKYQVRIEMSGGSNGPRGPGVDSAIADATGCARGATASCGPSQPGISEPSGDAGDGGNRSRRWRGRSNRAIRNAGAGRCCGRGYGVGIDFRQHLGRGYVWHEHR